MKCQSCGVEVSRRVRCSYCKDLFCNVCVFLLNNHPKHDTVCLRTKGYTTFNQVVVEVQPGVLAYRAVRVQPRRAGKA